MYTVTIPAGAFSNDWTDGERFVSVSGVGDDVGITDADAVALRAFLLLKGFAFGGIRGFTFALCFFYAFIFGHGY